MKHDTDSFAASMIWGRIGVALLCLVSFGLSSVGADFSAEMQAEVFDTISNGLIGLAAMLAIVSKVREQIK
jgi:ABC-type nickel/cobalt efflux system permease component RcnA